MGTEVHSPLWLLLCSINTTTIEHLLRPPRPPGSKTLTVRTRPVHTHTRTQSTYITHTHKSFPHTRSSGPHMRSSARSSKTEEVLKRDCCYRVAALYSSEAKRLSCGFSIVLLGSRSAESNPFSDCATFNAQRHTAGSQPGPNLGPWRTGGSSACPASESAGETTHRRRRIADKFPRINTLVQSNTYRM